MHDCHDGYDRYDDCDDAMREARWIVFGILVNLATGHSVNDGHLVFVTRSGVFLAFLIHRAATRTVFFSLLFQNDFNDEFDCLFLEKYTIRSMTCEFSHYFPSTLLLLCFSLRRGRDKTDP